MSSGWTAWRDVPADQRLAAEQALEHLAEDGFVVTSRELSRDGPWRIEIFGEGERPGLHGDWTWEGEHARCTSTPSDGGKTMTAHHERSDDGVRWVIDFDRR